MLHVDAGNNIVTVASESGRPVDLTVDANTQFFFREPQNPVVDSSPIAAGTAFLANRDLVRGFKIHASVVDPLATPLIAQSIDIETAVYSGQISSPDGSGFTLTRAFRTLTDDYARTLDYISSATANGKDDAGNAVTGFKWWNFAYPTQLMSGTGAVVDFVSATGGSVDLGGSMGTVPSRGVSFASWNDPANPDGWAAAATILTPSALPLGFVATGLANNAFTVTVIGGTTAATVDIGTVAGSATLVYQVDCTNGIVTVTPIDVTSSDGLASVTAVVAYFTGQAPAQ